jgi:DNA-directed RNA polymerase subunit M/transcription elongation factor TFIIS
MIRVSCPKCKTILQVEDKQAGQVIACSTCKTSLRLPKAPALFTSTQAASTTQSPTPESKKATKGVAPADKWFVARRKKKDGPFTLNQLKQLASTGNLKPTDMVLKEGCAKWLPAGEIKELFASPAIPAFVQTSNLPVVTLAPATSLLRSKWKEIYGREVDLIELVIVELFHRLVPKANSLYLFPNIPKTKLTNAKEIYANLRPDELLLGQVDNTTFGSAKVGYLLTTQGVYWHNTGPEDVGHCTYADILPGEVVAKTSWVENKVMLTPSAYLAASTISKDIVEGIATFVKHAAAFTLASVGRGHAAHTIALAALSDAMGKGQLDVALPESLRQLPDEIIPSNSKKANGREEKTQAVADAEQSVSCPACKESYNIDLKNYGGKKIKCKKCQAIIDVPRAAVQDEFEVVEEAPSPPASSRSDGSSDQQRHKDRLVAVPVQTSWPGQPPGYTAPQENVLFCGDGFCPKCRSILWLDWKLSYDLMGCPACRFEFDGEMAISIVTSHEPSKNAGDFERLREVIKMKKEATIQQMESDQKPQQQPDYPSGYTPNPVVEAMIAQHHRTTQQVSENTSPSPAQEMYFWDCPWCGEGYEDGEYDPDQDTSCSECGCCFQKHQALNLRTTLERVETHGFLKKMWSGSSIQSSRYWVLVGLIRQKQALISLYSLNGGSEDLQRAQLLQMQVAELKRELDRGPG